MKTSWFARVLVLAMCVTMLCANALAAPADWSTTVAGAMGEKAEAKDDFFTYVNYDWTQTASIPDGYSSYGAFMEVTETVMGQVIDLLQNGEATSHDAELPQILYRKAIDLDKRNADGVAELAAEIEAIEAFDSMDDLTAYQTDPNAMYGVLLGVGVTTDFVDSTLYVGLTGDMPLSLGDPAEYAARTDYGTRVEEANIFLMRKIYAHMGRTEEEGEAVYRKALEVESKIAPYMFTVAQQSDPSYYAMIYNVMTPEEVYALNDVYPMKEMMVNCGLDKCPMIIVTNPQLHAACEELYVEENLEGFKAMLIYQYIAGACGSLDQACLDIGDAYSAMISGSQGSLPIEQRAYLGVSNTLPSLVGRMYAEAYFTEETRQDVLSMIEKIVAVYRSRLENNDWLSEATREQAIHKLDSMRVNVGYGAKWPDYSGLNIPADCTYYGAKKAVAEYESAQAMAKIGTRVDPDEWGFATQEVNAFYNPADNSINILAGILSSPFYTPGGSMEANLGAIGIVIGHEITHAFDATGSQFDADGNMVNWWTDEDRAAFEARSAKVADYFSAIEVLPGVPSNGVMMQGEAVADLGGMSAALEIAKGVEGFDYNAFFEAFAAMWRQIDIAESLEYLVRFDPHPANHLRVNVTLQQFDEFYETYGIAEGDGMYLAPDQRLNVW